MLNLNVKISDDTATLFGEIKKRGRYHNNDEAITACIKAAYNYLIRGKEHENSES